MGEAPAEPDAGPVALSCRSFARIERACKAPAMETRTTATGIAYLRTPEERFTDLDGFACEPCYVVPRGCFSRRGPRRS